MVGGECWLCSCPACPGGCLPVTVETRPGVGNCLVATHHIPPGGLVFSDSPAVWGPNLKSPPKVQ